jgi:predicted RNA methylase
MYIPHSVPRQNVLGYLFWRWLLKKSGRFLSRLDAWFFGPSRGMNDYDVLAVNYKGSNVKPDKLYSILPTVLDIVGDCKGKTVIDVGCGAGFFTLPFAKLGASHVCGVDNSREQIELASRVSPHLVIRYVVADVFTQYSDTPVDIITAPFVVNYARTLSVLKHFFELIHKSLRKGGKAVFVIDLPNGKSLRRFGATKTLLGLPADETRIQIELFNDEKKICELLAVYYTPQTVERLLREIGFKNIYWYRPLISEEGISVLGPCFWEGYTDDPELGYLVVEK